MFGSNLFQLGSMVWMPEVGTDITDIKKINTIWLSGSKCVLPLKQQIVCFLRSVHFICTYCSIYVRKYKKYVMKKRKTTLVVLYQ